MNKKRAKKVLSFLSVSFLCLLLCFALALGFYGIYSDLHRYDNSLPDREVVSSNALPPGASLSAGASVDFGGGYYGFSIGEYSLYSTYFTSTNAADNYIMNVTLPGVYLVNSRSSDVTSNITTYTPYYSPPPVSSGSLGSSSLPYIGFPQPALSNDGVSPRIPFYYVANSGNSFDFYTATYSPITSSGFAFTPSTHYFFYCRPDGKKYTNCLSLYLGAGFDPSSVIGYTRTISSTRPTFISYAPTLNDLTPALYDCYEFIDKDYKRIYICGYSYLNASRPLYNRDIINNLLQSPTPFTVSFIGPDWQSTSSYQAGYNDGVSASDKSNAIKINTAYADGLSQGYNDGYEVGYNQGVVSANDYSFFSLIAAVVDAPIKAFTGLLHFEILGYDMSLFLLSLLSISFILRIVLMVVGK